MLNIKEMEKFKEQLLTFKDILNKTGLAPASPTMMTFFTFMLVRYSERLKWFTGSLIVLTGVLAALAIWDIVLRLHLYVCILLNKLS